MTRIEVGDAIGNVSHNVDNQESLVSLQGGEAGVRG